MLYKVDESIHHGSNCWRSGGQSMSVEGCEDVTVQYSGVRENNGTLRYNRL